ncbi:hypothetical protein RND71_038859 [Anisodus tanguticus]|uniref:Uncharacterized protein n=1 Tax=Anisodus tanguticus TaxID=243964 RepID=A0AAE1USH3_9SOLA|nr:hypothetical protein RND71_038859 [Anisodus tanguticus]
MELVNEKLLSNDLAILGRQGLPQLFKDMIWPLNPMLEPPYETSSMSGYTWRNECPRATGWDDLYVPGTHEGLLNSVVFYSPSE